MALGVAISAVLDIDEVSDHQSPLFASMAPVRDRFLVGLEPDFNFPRHVVDVDGCQAQTHGVRRTIGSIAAIQSSLFLLVFMQERILRIRGHGFGQSTIIYRSLARLLKYFLNLVLQFLLNTFSLAHHIRPVDTYDFELVPAGPINAILLLVV